MSITFEHVGHTYSAGTPYEYAALKDVNLNITEGKITAVIGQTGSGKSTLVQHLNALLLPDQGKIEILGRVITASEKPKGLKSLRGDVGMVFQFPEYQLFEETVIKDVMFGPKNFGLTEEQAHIKAANALKMTGLEKETWERSPLELSGGQKRRAAIAGILAMDPKVLVLDEPTAGLDPVGTVAMMDLFSELNRKHGKTVLIVTHDMEQVFRYCDEVVVVEKGGIRAHMTTEEFFHDAALCESMHILPPSLIRMKVVLREKGFTVPDGISGVKELAECIAAQVKKHG